jgi:hypothetical protein
MKQADSQFTVYLDETATALAKQVHPFTLFSPSKVGEQVSTRHDAGENVLMLKLD